MARRVSRRRVPRRPRGLSGSPEHHSGEADFFAKAARTYAAESIGNSKVRNCEAAFESLVDAIDSGGKMEAHSKESGKAKTAATISSKAEATFYKKCVLRRK